MVELKKGEIVIKKKDLVDIKRNIQSLLKIRDELQKAKDLHELYKHMKRIEEMTFDPTITEKTVTRIEELMLSIDNLLNNGRK